MIKGVLTILKDAAHHHFKGGHLQMQAGMIPFRRNLIIKVHHQQSYDHDYWYQKNDKWRN
jgi:hypothetical protein